MIDKEVLANRRVLCATDSDDDTILTKFMQHGNGGYSADEYKLTSNGWHWYCGWGGSGADGRPINRATERRLKEIDLLDCDQCKHKLACLINPHCGKIFESKK